MRAASLRWIASPGVPCLLPARKRPVANRLPQCAISITPRLQARNRGQAFFSSFSIRFIHFHFVRCVAIFRCLAIRGKGGGAERIDSLTFGHLSNAALWPPFLFAKLIPAVWSGRRTM